MNRLMNQGRRRSQMERIPVPNSAIRVRGSRGDNGAHQKVQYECFHSDIPAESMSP